MEVVKSFNPVRLIRESMLVHLKICIQSGGLSLFSICKKKINVLKTYSIFSDTFLFVMNKIKFNSFIINKRKQ